MSSSLTSRVLRLALTGALAAGALAAAPAAQAAPADHLVIDEVYVNGGSSGASFKNKYVEVHNPTGSPVDVAGWSIQYRSATGTGNFSGVIALGDHTVPAGGTLLVGANSNNATTNPGADLPTPDVASTVAFAGGGGTLALARTTTALAGAPSTVLADPAVVDLVGYGSSTTFEGSAAATGTSLTKAVRRTGGTDTNDNRADLSAADPTPTACGTACDSAPAPVEPAPVVPIAEIQGTGTASPIVGQRVTTRGVVTAAYPDGGFDGAYIQTEGTGDVDLDTHRASTGLFVASAALADDVEIGDHLEVTGTVEESSGLTQLTVPAGGWTVLTEPAVAPKAAEVAFPLDDTQRESLEGMLLAPQGAYTVTNNFATNSFGEVGLAAGTRPLPQPTDVVRPRTQAYTDLVADNARRLITLDDGASVNYVNGSKDVPLPWLTADNEVRQGAPATFVAPVVLDFRFGWKLQPTTRLTGVTDAPATFGATRAQERTPAPVDGELKLASFNVLNYFPTTGEKYVASGRGTCTYYTDRAGTPITNNTCTNNGPRGAANDASLARQQVKIVKAINTLDADVVALQELENSATLGQPRDTALQTLVAALNADAGADVWAGAASPTTVPTTGEDVIRPAFIYRTSTVETAGEARILDDPAFANARAPLAQEFRAKGVADSDFVVIANHFKSKGSGSGENADQRDGQGASNPDRVRQAQALVAFVDDVEKSAGTDRVLLAGDFNSYSKEDPMRVLEDAGFTNVTDRFSEEDTYQFGGLLGSLDHVFASPSATRRVRGADVWRINAPEAIAREYSRFNYNVTNLYDTSPFRASDHDPTIVGLDVSPAAGELAVDGPRTRRLGDVVDVDVQVSSSLEGVVPTGEVTLRDGDTALGTATLDGGRATIALRTADLGVGTHVLRVEYAGDAQTRPVSADYRITVLKSEADLAATIQPTRFGTQGTVEVTAAPAASGLVYVVSGSTVVGIGSLREGSASVRISGTALEPGSHRLQVLYAGNDSFEPDDVTVEHTVTKARPVVRATAPRGKVVVDRTRAVVPVRVSADGFRPDGGTVRVRLGSTILGTATLRNGAAEVRLRPLRSTGTRRFTVEYLGDRRTGSAAVPLTIRVVRR
ncbi:MAG: ExeM/NucH family extracellular endonuclease [Aeromicrobium erythreum]